HEMLDDQLAASVKEIGERLLATRAIEDVFLLDFDPGQLAALAAQLIAQPSQLLLLAQMLLTRSDPLVSGHDSVLHCSLPDVATSCRRLSPGNWRGGPDRRSSRADAHRAP